jgi:2Fe-2S ferredoxin
MPSILFIHPDGARQEVEVGTGSTVMRAAVAHDIAEIVAECGGNASCATCHVYVDPQPGLPPRSVLEEDMLELTAEPRRENSRLACQIVMTTGLDRLEVRLPATQL